MKKLLISFAALSIATAQQSSRIDDTALKTAGKSGSDWLTYGLNQSETRYSPLNQINTGNVSRLGLEWSYNLGLGGGRKKLHRWSGTALSTGSLTGAWSSPWMRAREESAGVGIRR